MRRNLMTSLLLLSLTEALVNPMNNAYPPAFPPIGCVYPPVYPRKKSSGGSRLQAKELNKRKAKRKIAEQSKKKNRIRGK